MKRTIIRSTSLVAVCLIASNLPSTAQVINGSFEDTSSPWFSKTNGQPYSDQYPPYNTFPTVVMFNGWESASRNGGIRYNEVSISGFSGADGSYAVEALDDGSLESLNPVTTIAADKTYTLTLSLNLPSGSGSASFRLLATSQGADPNTYSVGGSPTSSPNPLITTLGTLADSSAVYTGANTLTGGAAGTTAFQNYTISFNTLNGDNASFLTDNLSILVNLSGGESVDNIVLTETPEPSTWALMFAGAGGLLFIGRRKLNA